MPNTQQPPTHNEVDTMKDFAMPYVMRFWEKFDSTKNPKGEGNPRTMRGLEIISKDVVDEVQSLLEEALLAQKKQIEERDDMLDDMWGLICNTNGGILEGEKQEWKDAFFRIRDKYFSHLHAVKEALSE